MFGKRATVDTGPSTWTIAFVIIVCALVAGYFFVNQTPKPRAAAQTPPAAVIDTTKP
ncbi:MAG: hypothetical protein AAB948_02200 [Patescibacteria group bacterium]